MSDATHTSTIHIVGLYKCGTTWLLRALAAHPEVVAWREFDPLRAAWAPDRRLRALPALLLAYLRRRPDSPRWVRRIEAARARSAEDTFRDMFLGHGWLPVMGAAAQERAAGLATGNLEALLDELLELTALQHRAPAAPPLDPVATDRPLGVAGCQRSDLLELMRAVRDTTDAALAPGLFYAFLASQVRPGARIACKAADQLLMLDRLSAVCPGARRVAIIRDGRDAAVSARHYEQLMRTQQAPWRVGRSSSPRRLLGWALRAAKLAGHARRGDLAVVRYEDLSRDFTGTLAALLRTLQLDAAPSLLASIEDATRFAAASGGRAPGEAAPHILRKGVVGDWRDALSPREARLAWRIAGRELAAFGYRPDGGVAPSDLVLSAD